ncbi:MAG TPA: hypothetical protein VM286_10455 [Candidatus Thermoplasmatota archaeon]|nr:hypothetical protein [Candidatus Thermoplasmatota archaeon]
MHDWAVPVLVALVAFGGLLGAAQLVPPASPAPFVAVFPTVAVDTGAPTTLLAVRAAGGWSAWLPVQGPGPLQAEGRALAEAALAGPGPRFGREGADTVALTVYAFTPKGRLLASNAAPADMARYPRDTEFQALGPVLLHLGAGPAPGGAAPLPPSLAGLAAPLRAALAGQPEGGVAVLRIAEGPVAEAFGAVTLALRVDRLITAAPAGGPSSRPG